QELTLAPRECAQNSGTFVLVRMLLGLLVYFSLSTIFPIPGESMLGAVVGLKANVLLFIGVLAALFFASLFGLFVAFPLNNVLTSVNKDLSKSAMIFRFVEAVLFISGMVLLIAEIPLFNQVLVVGLIFYGLHLIIIGYLVFITGYLSRVLGIILITGGALGYLTVGVTQYFVPSLVWLSTIGALIAVIAEISLGIIFVVKARQIEHTDPVETITIILQKLSEATTKEIIAEASKISPECPDRIPGTLLELEQEEKVSKRFSKEKKGYVWTLSS
ncbi:MAG: DUF4386 domain-containing protein, partial [Candidatus Thorarchaeota archaeon]